MPKKDEVLPGMPEPTSDSIKLTFVNAKTWIDKPHEQGSEVTFKVSGFLYEQGTRILDDAESPSRFEKVKVTRIEELK